MPKKKRETRVWTDAERATAVAMAARFGENVKRTVRVRACPACGSTICATRPPR